MADVAATEQRTDTEKLAGSGLNVPLRQPGDCEEATDPAQPEDQPSASGPPARPTPLWTLKATQLFGTAAYACLAKFLPVFYLKVRVSLTHIGILQLLGPLLAFVGNLFWSVIIDKTGDFKTILVSTSVLGTAITLLQLLPEVQQSVGLLYAVTAASSVCLCTGGPIVDAMCLTVLEENSGSGEVYGDQRLWCAVGWGTMSLVIGQLIDLYGMNIAFAGFAFFTVINLAILVFWFPSPKKRSRPDGNNAAQGDTEERFLSSVLTFETLWFFTNLLLYGMAFSLVENLLLVFLKNDFKHTTNLILGSAVAIMCAFEVPVFKFVDRLWTRCSFGLTGVIAACQLLLALRCVLYLMLPEDKPWLALFIEPLHGITFAGMWSATVEYGKRLAPAPHVATMQAAVNGLYYFVAIAVGSAIWGVVVEPPEKGGIGFRSAFVVDAIFILVWSAVWHMGVQVNSLRTRRHRSARAPRPADAADPPSSESQQ